MLNHHSIQELKVKYILPVLSGRFLIILPAYLPKVNLVLAESKIEK